MDLYFVVDKVEYYVGKDHTHIRRVIDNEKPTSQRAVALAYLRNIGIEISKEKVNTHTAIRYVVKNLLQKETNESPSQPKKVKRTFRHSAGFGKRIEYYIIGLMLKEGLDVYVPMVDDDSIDAVIRKEDGSYIEIQIKARSKTVVSGDAALFAALKHNENRVNHDKYYYVFYSERLDKIWILSGDEFVKEAVQNKTGKNKGKRSLWFNGKRKGVEYAKEKYDRYLSNDFKRFKLKGVKSI